MRAKQSQSAESVVKEIRRQTRRKFTSEEKIRIVLEGLKGEASISKLCRREGIVSNLYYRWSKDFLEAGKKRLRAPSVLIAIGVSDCVETSLTANGAHRTTLQFSKQSVGLEIRQKNLESSVYLVVLQ